MRKLFKRIIILAVFVVIVISILKYTNIKTNILKKIYKIEYTEYVEQYSKEYEIDKYLIYSIIKAESNFNENAISNKKAMGLMQLMYTTAEELSVKTNIELNEENILNPDINIKLGTYYISYLVKKYDNLNLALAAYNAGSGNVDNWLNENILLSDGSNIENVPFKETNIYVRKILRDYKIYKEIYNQKDV